jgi:tetratricopeptide (TPR) repeat protein
MIIFFFIGFLIRLPFLLLSLRGVNSDQAMGGLMGIHILRGDFPIFWWGQGYMGPVDSYLNAIVTYLFGLSNINSTIIPFLFSLFFPFITYLLAREVFNREVAIFSFIFSSVPTVFFIILLKGDYMMPVFIGSLLLLLTVRLLKEKIPENKEYSLHIVLGFLSGLGFWINWIILPYLATVFFFFFIKDRVFFMRRQFLIFCVSFFVGSLPFWIFNLTHDFWTFALLSGAGQRNPILATKVLLLDNIPLFLGLKYVDYPWSPFTILLGIIYIFLFSSLLIGIFRLEERKGMGVLIVFATLVCLSFIFSRFGGLGSPRYLFPLYSVLPIFISFSLSYLKGRGRYLLYIISIIILSGNLYAVVDAYSAFKKPSERDPDTKGLVQFLKSKGIRHAYSDYTLVPRLTFESKEEIICAEPVTERYQRYRDVLNTSYNFAYVFRLKGNPLESAFFGDNLKAGGISYKKDDIDAFRVFHSFSPPPPQIVIPREGWMVESNFKGEDAWKAIDNDVWTRWGSGEPKKEGMWFMIDMGKSFKVSGISIFPGKNPADSMVGYAVETSLDKRHWITIASIERCLSGLYWEQGGPRFDDSGRLRISFDAVDARYIRINHKGSHRIYDWSIAEIFLYGSEFSDTVLEEYPWHKHIEEGRSFEDKGEYIEAMRRYLKAITLYGDIEEAFHRLMILGQRLDIPEGPLYIRALAFERYGLIEKAADEYEKILSYNSYSSELIRRLADLKKKMGESEKASVLEKMLDGFIPTEKQEVIFGDSIKFIGYDLSPIGVRDKDKSEISGGKSFQITYYWKAIGRIKKDWMAFVHFLGPDGKIAFQNDHPLYSGYNYSSDWVKGEIYKERFLVEIPEDAMPGNYRIVIGLWDPKTGERLKVKEGLLKKMTEITIGELRFLGKER